jgi:Lysophospholipase
MVASFKESSFSISGNDGKEVTVYNWSNVEKPRAVVQIIHGMAEHAARYGRLAAFLNENRIAVYGEDHRGHGRTAGSVEKLGCIGKDGFNNIVEDNHILFNKIKQMHPEIPVIILGHSFGSFITQEYITRYGNELAGVILSGTSMMDDMEVKAGSILAAILKTVFGEEKQSKFLDGLSFNSYNRRVSNPAGKFDWLSRDREELQKYEQDPYCGTVFTTGFYYYFLKDLNSLYKEEKLDRIPKDLPIFIAAGDSDPLGKYGRDVEKLHSLYINKGLKSVRFKLYPGARHEILNEINRDEVMKEFLGWILERIPA